MNFRPELADRVMDGSKTVTRRLTSENPRSPWSEDGCALKVGRDYAVCPGRGKNAIARVRVIAADLMALGGLSAEDAGAEGFDSVADFEKAWAAINGGYDPGAWVWRVEFEVVSDRVRGREDHEHRVDQRQERDDAGQPVHGLLRTADGGSAVQRELSCLDHGRVARAGVVDGHAADDTRGLQHV